MDIPFELVKEIALALITIIGSAIALLLKLLLNEIVNLRNKLDKFSEELSKLHLIVAKVLLVQSTCENCPHPRMEIDTGLGIKLEK